MIIGETLLDLARAGGSTALFVIGTAKNSGKTVTARAIADAARRRGMRIGLTSTGRDGEAFDAIDSLAKPRFFLRAGTIVATARNLVPPHPASEILDVTSWHTASGNVVFVAPHAPGYFEPAGPARANEMRQCILRFGDFGCNQVIIDGAIDRVAAVAGGAGSVILAVGAQDASTIDEAAQTARGIVQRLTVPAYDPARQYLRIEGALTLTLAARFAQFGETRQIVVGDPTQIALPGAAFLSVAERLNVRCESPLNIVAATVASIGRERSFEPRRFARAVRAAIELPVFDVYTGEAA